MIGQTTPTPDAKAEAEAVPARCSLSSIDICRRQPTQVIEISLTSVHKKCSLKTNPRCEHCSKKFGWWRKHHVCVHCEAVICGRCSNMYKDTSSHQKYFICKSCKDACEKKKRNSVATKRRSFRNRSATLS
eukprot:TRINITY_DN8266_c0_g1_i3.p1 TRINITY_DN8266_c0_g1~~TRINITY_DN8266_c0_g1_i3.p1  ORF type:complete len:131 (-),score=8.24 TRINITY_DN8266_c0_g1_i3:43-435(-)